MSTGGLTPLKAIHERCLWCMGADGTYRRVPAKLVRECTSTLCPLTPFREGRRGTNTGSPLKAILATCWDCMAGDRGSIKTSQGVCSRTRPTKLTRQCVVTDCTLYPFRLGKRG
jgi:hypothetical protein